VKTIEITIDESGKTTVEAQGFTGSSCTDATKAIEQALGAVSHDTKKPEYYQAAQVQTHQRSA
jgi:hypothetical protein